MRVEAGLNLAPPALAGTEPQGLSQRGRGRSPSGRRPCGTGSSRIGAVREGVLYTLLGLLIGFLVGYLVQEEMAARQPARIQPGSVAPGGAGIDGGAGGMQAMQQILALRDYVESNPDDLQAVRTLANLNFTIQQWERAAELYRHALELEPDDPDVVTDLGVCYREMERFQDALELFHRAQELQPGHWQSLYNQVVVLAYDLGRPDDAGPALQRLLEVQPDNPSVQQLASEIGRLDEATPS